jgi:predicted O-methyltransferase YrrM
LPSGSGPEKQRDSERLLFGRIPLRRAFRTALRHPSSVVRFARADAELSAALSVSRNQIAKWRRELVEVARLPRELVRRYERAVGQPMSTYSGGGTIGATNEVLYLFVRAARPSLVVETGVAAGFSSAYLLQGLADNGSGALVSIDLPTVDPAGRISEDGTRDATHVPASDQTGYVVPDGLRDRWTLRLGPSRELLPATLASAGPIDMFFHDSDHSYSSMKWEYETAWPHLAPGGWLLSDDIDRNSAFVELSRSTGSRPFVWADGHRGALRRA